MRLSEKEEESNLKDFTGRLENLTFLSRDS